MTKSRTILVSHNVYNEGVAKDIPDTSNLGDSNSSGKTEPRLSVKDVSFDKDSVDQEESFEENEFAAYSPEAAAFMQFATIDAIIMASHDLANVENSNNIPEIRRHRLRFWRNKRRRNHEFIKDSVERSTKRHNFRKWLNRPQDDSEDFGVVYENRNRACAIGHEAARIATIRFNARAAARAGALEAANAARMASISNCARKVIGACALETAKLAREVVVRLNATRAIQAGAFEAAKLAQEKMVVQALQNSVCKLEEGAIGTTIPCREGTMSSNVPSSESNNSGGNSPQHPWALEDENQSVDEGLKKEIDSRIALLYDQFEVVSPAFPELEPPTEQPSTLDSPAETQSAGKSEVECWNCILPRIGPSSITKSLFTESFEEGSNSHGLNIGELTPLTENEGFEASPSTVSDIFAWFCKEPKITDNSNNNNPTPRITDNLWKSFGKQVGFLKAEKNPDLLLDVTSPFGDDQVGYAF